MSLPQLPTVGQGTDPGRSVLTSISMNPSGQEKLRD
jgi:hypothetical protein